MVTFTMELHVKFATKLAQNVQVPSNVSVRPVLMATSMMETRLVWNVTPHVQLVMGRTTQTAYHATLDLSFSMENVHHVTLLVLNAMGSSTPNAIAVMRGIGSKRGLLHAVDAMKVARTVQDLQSLNVQNAMMDTTLMDRTACNVMLPVRHALAHQLWNATPVQYNFCLI